MNLLTPREQQLFDRLPACDQRHSLAICAAVQTEQPQNTSLQVAALLHDVGKGRPTRTERVLLALMSSYTPWLLIRWRRNRLNGWRGRLARLVVHTDASANFAELAGSSVNVVATLRAYGHRDQADGRFLAELDGSK